MSKMRMPEMDVVRFQESDVIVASLVVSKAVDGVDHNLTITRNGTDIFFNGKNGTDFNNMGSYYATRDDGNYYFYTNGTVNAYTLDAMIQSDNNASDLDVDGRYIYTGNGNFERQ